METAGVIPEIVIVDATVTGVGMFRNKTRISLNIPAFKSDYDVHCTDYPEGMAAGVGMGEPFRLELRRQSRVKAQEGKPSNDGTRAFHYYWGINGRSEGPLTVFGQEQRPAATSQPPAGNGSRNDPAGISIERQVAYKGAIELAVVKLQQGGSVRMVDILWEAEEAAAWIHGGPVVADPPDAVTMAAHARAAVSEAPTPQEAFDDLGSGSHEGEPEIGNLGAFFTTAMDAGHGDSRAVLKKLGVTKPVEILAQYETFDAALKKLEVEKEAAHAAKGSA